MAASAFVPPPNLTFNLGTTEAKIGMTLDDLVKASKAAGKKVPRVGVKNSNKVPTNPTVRRAALQKAVATRSSTIRQGKLAEVRAKNSKAGATLFPRARAQVKRALATPVTTTDKQFARQAGAAAVGTGSASRNARRRALRRMANAAVASAAGAFPGGGSGSGILSRLAWPGRNGNGARNGSNIQNGNRAQNANGASGAANGQGGRIRVTIVNEKAIGGKRAK